MIRVLIADDELPARRRLRRLIADVPDAEVVGEAASGAATVDAARALRPDVVLLDVQMPEGDGFDVVAALDPSEAPLIVFVTAYDEYAVRAFEVAAADYILKPFAPDRLHAAFDRIRGRLAAERPAGEPEALERVLREVAPRRASLTHLLVAHGPRSVFLPMDRVDWVESDRNNVTLHAAGHAFTVRSTLQALDGRLDPDRFLRINRSQLVRLEAVREVHPWSHGDRHVVMHDGTRLVWSRRFRSRDDDRFGLK